MKVYSEATLILADAVIVAWFTMVLFSILFAAMRLARRTTAAFAFAWRLIVPAKATAFPKAAKRPLAAPAPRVSGEAQWILVTGTVARGITLATSLGRLQERAAEQVGAASYRLAVATRELAALKPAPRALPAPAPARPVRIAKTRDRKLAA